MKILLIVFFSFYNILIFSQDISSQYPLQKLLLGDFLTENNDTIKSCFITYRVFGKVNEDSSNIIFFPTWLGGNSENIGMLLAKYSFTDTNKFCIISIDALGNGYSASPSNSPDFPKISFEDLTKAYYITLTERLKISNLYAIVGGSMGGMTAFHFAVKYPDYVNRIVPYVSSPKLSTYDLLWTNLQINLVEYLISLNAPQKKIKAFSDMITALISRTPKYLNKSVQVSDFDSYFNKFYKEPDSVYILNNYLCQLKAITSYDLSKYIDKNLENGNKLKLSKMLIIVSDSDMMVNTENAISFAEFSKSEIAILKNDCGHMAVNCEMDKVRTILNNFLTSN